MLGPPARGTTAPSVVLAAIHGSLTRPKDDNDVHVNHGCCRKYATGPHADLRQRWLG